jgi:aspartyl-tRNA(Asn)/glutamyl-tRNA(Gln) amidotransferase subunit A
MSAPADLDAGRLLGRLEAGEVSAVEILRSCLARIDALDPELNAFVRPNPRAEEEAAASDARRATGEAGPLEGLPVAVKDNLDTAGLETSCASSVLEGFLPTDDATAIARLRGAGAVLLGKTNLDEFAMGSSTEHSAHGPSRNPWDPTRVPGGSSGGSAVAVAARMAPLALGSDTGGSVRQPAAFCGVVGLKPTYGRVSRYGLVAFGSSLDQIGALARSVGDVARLLGTVAGADPHDATSSNRPLDDYMAACEAEVRGLRVGLPREYFDDGLDPDVERAVRGAADVLARQGAAVEEVTLPHTRYSIPTYYLVATAEASSNLARYDGVRYGRREPAAEGPESLRMMYRRNRSAGFGPEVKRRIMLGTYALSAGYYDRFYGKAQRARTLLSREFAELFSSGIDLLLTPATPSTAFKLGEKADDPLQMYLSDVYTTTANLVGIPGLSVPAGRTADGLPVGCQLLAPHFEESRLFRAGAALENAYPVELPAWVAGRLGDAGGSDRA